MEVNINDLPNEMLLQILNHSTAYDMARSFQYVCQRWFNLINNNETLWRGQFQKKGIGKCHSKNELVKILMCAPKLKYLELNYHYLCDTKNECALTRDSHISKNNSDAHNADKVNVSLSCLKQKYTKDNFNKKLFNVKTIITLSEDADNKLLKNFQNISLVSSKTNERSSDLTKIICSRNRDIEHLKIFEPHPPFQQFKKLLKNLPNLKRISVKLMRLRGRMETVNELKKILGEFPDIDVDFLNEISCDWHKLSNNTFVLAPITSYRYFDCYNS